MHVAILRCEKLPRFVTWEIPDINVFFEDDRLLIDEFRKKGIEASHVVWSDPSINWNEYDVALIRSTWDYIDRCEEFLNVLAGIESSSCQLYNSYDVVKWNSDKHYLPDLEKAGIPIVPTFLADRTDIHAIRDIFLLNNWHTIVTKPIIGGGGAGVTKISTSDLVSRYHALASEDPDHTFIIQPLIESVMAEGEWSYFIIDGNISHVLLKKPAPGDYRAHAIYGGSMERKDPTDSDRNQVKTMLELIPFLHVYARLDLVRFEEQLVIMELELIEPMFYFDYHPHAAAELVHTVIRRFEK